MKPGLIDIRALGVLQYLDDAGLSDLAAVEDLRVSAPVGQALCGLSLPLFRERVARMRGTHDKGEHYQLTLKEMAVMRGGHPVTGRDLRQVIDRLSRPAPKRTYRHSVVTAEEMASY
jgi:hypothetical protein